MCAFQCYPEGFPVCFGVREEGGRGDCDRVSRNPEYNWNVVRSTELARGQVVVEVQRGSVCEGKVWASRPSGCEAGGEVRPQKSEAF